MNTAAIPCAAEGATNHGSRGVAPTLYRTHVAVTAVEMFARFFAEQFRPVATGHSADVSGGTNPIHDGSDTL